MSCVIIVNQVRINKCYLEQTSDCTISIITNNYWTI